MGSVCRAQTKPRRQSAKSSRDLRHLADEFDLDWDGLARRAGRFYEEESERYVVQLSVEGFQIRDTAADQLKADIWASRSEAEQACAALSAGRPAAKAA